MLNKKQTKKNKTTKLVTFYRMCVRTCKFLGLNENFIGESVLVQAFPLNLGTPAVQSII